MERPVITVATVVNQRHSDRHLVWELAVYGASPDDPIASVQRREQDLRHREWTATDIAIDGRQTAFGILSDGTAWVAKGVVGQYVIQIVGDGFPPSAVRLERIADVEPYLTARREFMRTLHR